MRFIRVTKNTSVYTHRLSNYSNKSVRVRRYRTGFLTRRVGNCTCVIFLSKEHFFNPPPSSGAVIIISYYWRKEKIN